MPESVSFSRIPADVLARWKAVRDVCEGDQALRAGDYLPYLNKHDKSEENRARNEAYRARAVFFGATGFTLEGLIGLAYRHDPQHNLPPKLEYLLTDVDGAGTSIYQQSQMVVSNNLQIGRHGLYVDYMENKSRGVIKSYVGESIINWRYSVVNGEMVLSLVILEEQVEVETADGYGLKIVTQWRELALVEGVFMCTIWVETAAGPTIQNIVIPQAARNNGALRYIPFQFIGSVNNDATIDKSPLYNLAQVNIAHFRNSADYEDSVFFVGQAQPWITGLTEEWRNHLENPVDQNGVQTGKALYIGSRNPILLPAGAAFGFAQAQPNTIVKEAMDQKEKQMIAIGARMIEATTANKTATGEDNDREATTSVLALVVSNVSEAYQQCIRWVAEYNNIQDLQEDKPTFQINQSFVKLAVDSQLIQALVKAWQSGGFAKTDLRAYLRKMGVLAVERTDEDIDDDLDTEGPPLGTPGISTSGLNDNQG